MGGQRARAIIQNNTDFNLTFVECHLSWGTWEIPPFPSITKRASGQLAFLAVGAMFSGTEGWAKYRPDGDANRNVVLTLCFDDPVRGSNDTDGTNSSAPHFTVRGDVPRSGSDVTFTYTINSA